jgi:hypothetical protein
MKNLEIAKVTMDIKSDVEGIIIPDLKLYCRAIVTKADTHTG